MAYIDGIVAAVPTTAKAKFTDYAHKAAQIFKDHGAERVVDCWGDDVPGGELTSFPKAVNCREDETVVFSWILWPSRKARDAGMKAAMEDPRMQPGGFEIPFDGKRMIFGGFERTVDV